MKADLSKITVLVFDMYSPGNLLGYTGSDYYDHMLKIIDTIDIKVKKSGKRITVNVTLKP